LGQRCWAYREFGVLLREMFDYRYCICCIRDIVNRKYNIHNIHKESYETIQPHYYVVDQPAVKINGVIYPNYSSKYMLRKNENMPYLGISEPFPVHTVERYEKAVLSKNVNGKVYRVHGLKEKSFVFF
jgi:hypothetical protein